MAIPNVNDAVLDPALAYFRANCTRVVACLGEPASFAEATTNQGTGSGKRLAQATVAAGDFSIAAGSGGVQRRLVFAGKEVAGAGLVTGNPDCLAWLDVANSVLLAVTAESSAVTIGAGSDVLFPAGDVLQIATPVSV